MVRDLGACYSFCPECGPGVSVDEDGCCVTCGSTSTGQAVDRLVRRCDRCQMREIGRANYPKASLAEMATNDESAPTGSVVEVLLECDQCSGRALYQPAQQEPGEREASKEEYRLLLQVAVAARCMALNDHQEAYHQLYMAVDPEFNIAGDPFAAFECEVDAILSNRLTV